jgi:hypothetical protein
VEEGEEPFHHHLEEAAGEVVPQPFHRGVVEVVVEGQ